MPGTRDRRKRGDVGTFPPALTLWNAIDLWHGAVQQLIAADVEPRDRALHLAEVNDLLGHQVLPSVVDELASDAVRPLRAKTPEDQGSAG